MARAAISVQTVPPFGLGTTLTMTAANQADGMSFVNDGKTVLIVRNLNASTRTVTVTGVAGARTWNSAVTKVFTLAATGATAGVAIIGPFDPGAFNQSTGVVHVDFSADTDVSIAACSLTKDPI